MRTVKELKEELDKFKDDDLCFAYEGDVTGIIVNRGADYHQGVIFCSESDKSEPETRNIEYVLNYLT